MRKLLWTKAALALGLTILMLPAASAVGKSKTIPFSDARLKIEYNDTDGDAGLQAFIDAEAWRSIVVTNPLGKQVIDVDADEVINDYGLTELFSESSEPPFDEFPFAEFKKLFPEGKYTFSGETVEGDSLYSTFNFTHKVLGAPEIVTPAEEATVPSESLVVDWEPVTSPAGVNVVAYQVLVVSEAPAQGNPVRNFDVTVPGSVTRMPVPQEFLIPGDYKAEVLAIEAGGNQTLTEHTFKVR